MKNVDPKEFLRDISEHHLRVHLDNGMYRHIRFEKTLDSVLWFDLVTWPGVLTIHGDMGTWTFSRVPDMFRFFRDDTLRINKSYWAEKLQHGVHGGTAGCKVFDEDLFRQQVMDRVKNYDLEDHDLAAVTEALKEQVLNQDNMYDLVIAVRDFSCPLPSLEPSDEETSRPRGRGRNFEFDCDDCPDGMRYAYQFVWCLYAIVWGIQQYDAWVAAKPKPATPPPVAEPT